MFVRATWLHIGLDIDWCYSQFELWCWSQWVHVLSITDWCPASEWLHNICHFGICLDPIHTILTCSVFPCIKWRGVGWAERALKIQCNAVASLWGHAPRTIFLIASKWCITRCVLTYSLTCIGKRNDELTCKHIYSIICKQSAGTQEIALGGGQVWVRWLKKHTARWPTSLII